jgi:hypothetical protein
MAGTYANAKLEIPARYARTLLSIKRRTAATLSLIFPFNALTL